jgi:hypothetical protein
LDEINRQSFAHGHWFSIEIYVEFAACREKVRIFIFIPHFPLPTAVGACVSYGGLQVFSLVMFWKGFRYFCWSVSDPPYDWPCWDAFFFSESFFSDTFWTSCDVPSFAVNETPVADPAVSII